MTTENPTALKNEPGSDGIVLIDLYGVPIQAFQLTSLFEDYFEDLKLKPGADYAIVEGGTPVTSS